jgi:mxaJ protein
LIVPAACALALGLIPSGANAQRIIPGGGPAKDVLRVCADPNNMPFSNENREGFENKIAEVLGKAMHSQVEYTWRAQRRGFIRNTLGARSCDVIIGMPTQSDMVRTTRPYYRSTYVFLYRRDRGYHITSLDDAALRKLRIGVHFIGADYGNPPVAQALARRGMVKNVVGYSIYGDYSKPNPPAALVDAVAKGDIDIAIIWGPFAGYFAPREHVPLEIVPVSPATDSGSLRYTFDISVAVRRGDDSLAVAMQHAIDTNRDAIRRILDHYHVPRAELPVADAHSHGGH